ncbi:MAG: DUF1254 domain-containing protein [Bacteroidetes bacterium]|nr:DUF1254 domain-containing protein [Bacteroidota bacterium]
MKLHHLLFATLILFLSLSCQQGSQKIETTTEPVIEGLGLTEQDVIDSWVYTLARYLVIRQEHIDMAEEVVDYNVIKYNELGKAEFVNPNLDVAYLEAWFAVDENTPVILEVPKVEGRYYTAQIVDEWAEILYNINERNFPDHPFGKYAICLKGSNPEIPEDALRIDIPSKKAKMLARVERKRDDEGALALQKAFRINKVGEPVIEPAIEIPMFTNKDLLITEVFQKPMIEKVLQSAPDAVSNSDDLQKDVLAIADFIEKGKSNKQVIEPIHKDDKEAMARFAKIGIKPGASFDQSAYSEEIIKAIEEGIAEANKKIAHKAQNIAEQVNGWNMMEA